VRLVSTTEIASNVYRVSISLRRSTWNSIISWCETRSLCCSTLDSEACSLFCGLKSDDLIDISKLRYIGFSHFVSDECGALNHWLESAPAAQPACGLIGALVSVNDFSIRTVRVLTEDDRLCTGQYRFQFIPTPHVPHRMGRRGSVRAI
jgi:hypothetical protein